MTKPNKVCTGRFAIRGAAFKGIKARASDTNRSALTWVEIVVLDINVNAQHVAGKVFVLTA